MKRMIAVAALGTMFGMGITAWAGAMAKHPNLEAAAKLLKQADAKISAAQAANEYDMDGHASKAKELIGQAMGELGQAAEAANAAKKK